ncbi:MAG: PAC2 family protein [Propionibacteriaceae bacterium]|nr:PAC2 family protein [Propionibacteriaceae bacterium]
MLETDGLYRYESQLPPNLSDQDLVLIHLFDGYIDAGGVNRGLRDYVLEQCEHERYVSFDIDQIHDYRSRRPMFIFDTNHLDSMIDFALVIYQVTDQAGKRFLLLTGPEPDHQWHRVSKAVFEICEVAGVKTLVTASGMPIAVPHTRPTLITQHSTDPQTISGNPMWIEKIQLPGSFSHFMEYQAGVLGLLASGYVAHVPHYLMQTRFPQAIAEVLAKINEFGELAIPVEKILERAVENLNTISEETNSDSDFPVLVQTLEEQYDRLQESGAASLPSAEEIGAVVERFLAEQEPPDYSR